ncbi:serine hydrolase [Sphingomonas sp. S2-65]|uniref:serine hydrolase n=1 Tax=Sphingomonas sp. S2-65 TaxID=2903960 RepID=UPI001F32BC3D|nr:serine hydrolase [Sphingomonas sp. S2-65]UYY59897.1 serine hydrolase [Sphingomonas sp. S2-65]
MRHVLTACALLALPVPALGQSAAPTAEVRPDPAFDARVQQLLAILQGSGDYAAFFAPAFVAQVPQPQFAAINAQLAAAHGAPRAVLGARPSSPWDAIVRVRFGDVVALLRLVVDPQPPHQVTGLLFQGFEAQEASIDAVVQAVRALPGQSGFALARLEAKGPKLLASYQPDRPLAIGSAFKLVILAELARSIRAGERKWEDAVTLDGSPLPGGAYATAPKGTQLSYRVLATQMISVSDNSATDILLGALGREKIEAMMPVIGIENAARNRPFLSTLELFKLKGVEKGALGRRFSALDEPGRRAMLAGEVAAAPLAGIDPTLFRDGKPVGIDTLEWFESPADLVRVLDWFRRNLTPELRAILGKNPGVPDVAAARWSWIGYKGGSEPGVMSMHYLLQARDGGWYALSASWNDPAKDVDQMRFGSLIARAVELSGN